MENYSECRCLLGVVVVSLEMLPLAVTDLVLVVSAGPEATAVGVRFVSSFLIFWKGASNSTVSTTEAINMHKYSLVSSCKKKICELKDHV